jgi:hypothetical protein
MRYQDCEKSEASEDGRTPCADDVVVGWDVRPVRDAGRAGEEAARKGKESFQWHARGG